MDSFEIPMSIHQKSSPSNIGYLKTTFKQPFTSTFLLSQARVTRPVSNCGLSPCFSLMSVRAQLYSEGVCFSRFGLVLSDADLISSYGPLIRQSWSVSKNTRPLYHFSSHISAG
uniref:Uncharacterized protein n=1 Tax=Anguilla anguilla TaxID=7936 RepID=A0A0E9VL42_ANGAN